VLVKINGGEPSGMVKAPSSKSMTHRELIISSLAEGSSILQYPLISDDTKATARSLSKLGAQITKNKESWIIEGGNLSTPSCILDCRESGTTLRLLTGVCSLIDGICELTGEPSLMRRPIKPLLDALNILGIKTELANNNSSIRIHGGRLLGGKVEIRGDISSQFISSLLIIAPYAKNKIEISITTQLESKPYIAMTLDRMKYHGVVVEVFSEMRKFSIPFQRYKACNSQVEGDWSSAAFFLAAGVLAGTITVTNLNLNSRQADKKIVKYLKKMGANIKIDDNSITSSKSSLSGINEDLSDCPDLFPIISALCSIAKGESVLTGLKRLNLKESDRVASMMDGLTKMGAEIKRKRDTVRIYGKQLKGAKINTFNDHRIAMSFAILGLISKGITIINDAECVKKSYPGFWSDLESIGVEIGRERN
jgi:3-phosphoshikimate 1-carboxyvinyltransferase